MKHSIKSIRTFIGSRNFNQSRSFYADLGFREVRIGDKMSYFGIDGFGFYLQDYKVKDWIDNSMVFLEVGDLDQYWDEISKLELPKKYKGVRLIPIKVNDWGREFFLHDPSGVLWHIGEFN